MFDSFTRGRFGHPIEHRNLTLREGARLQGFPDDYVFSGSKREITKQIGNAIPPPMAEAVAKSLRVTLQKSAFFSDGISVPPLGKGA
jgi:DNA (cytosine-5)-methyltransferase 1